MKHECWVFETDEYRNCLIVGVKGLDLHVLTSAWVEIGTAKNMSSAQALIDLRIEAFLTAERDRLELESILGA